MQRQVVKREVQVIQLTLRMGLTHSSLGTVIKQRVAAYARVSTEHEEQQSSYEAQVDYYTKKIKERSDWAFVEVYTEMLTLSMIQMHPPCTQPIPQNAHSTANWVHLSHFRSLFRVHFGNQGAPSQDTCTYCTKEKLRWRQEPSGEVEKENFVITSERRLKSFSIFCTM